MHGRQYSEGLHQAIEAKEGVTINTETLKQWLQLPSKIYLECIIN